MSKILCATRGGEASYRAQDGAIRLAEDRADELVLVIQDDGKGITQAQISNPKSLGLVGMLERAHTWNGEITFQGIVGQGTTVTVRIPRIDTGTRVKRGEQQ